MKNPRRTLFYIFFGYHILLFFGTLYIDSRQDDLGFLLNIKGYIPWMKYYAFLGLILFLLAYVVILRSSRLLSRDVERSKEEHTRLKAKLFDLEEEKKEIAGDSLMTSPDTQIPVPDDESTTISTDEPSEDLESEETKE